MLASPTFDGLRLSLSEESRLKYGEKPDSWIECIQNVELNNENIDINVKLAPGLNVVIGESSSGKSLFVDSVYKKIDGSFDESHYLAYGVEKIRVVNPRGQRPHYLHQNYIITICDPNNQEKNIDDISILKSVFPSDEDERQVISNGLSQLSSKLLSLVQAVKEIEKLQDMLTRISNLAGLIVTDEVRGNPLRHLLLTDKFIEVVSYGKGRCNRDVLDLDRIDELLTSNPLVSHDGALISKLKAELEQAYKYSGFELSVREIIEKYKQEADDNQQAESGEIAEKIKQFEGLLDVIGKYFKYEKIFRESLEAIAKFKIDITTKDIESMGHRLFIDNEFELTKEKFLDAVNSLLKKGYKIDSFEDLKPESFFKSKFGQKSPKVVNYDDFERRIRAKFENMNKKKYRITTREGKDFDNLSAG